MLDRFGYPAIIDKLPIDHDAQYFTGEGLSPAVHSVTSHLAVLHDWAVRDDDRTDCDLPRTKIIKLELDKNFCPELDHRKVSVLDEETMSLPPCVRAVINDFHIDGNRRVGGEGVTAGVTAGVASGVVSGLGERDGDGSPFPPDFDGGGEAPGSCGGPQL